MTKSPPPLRVSNVGTSYTIDEGLLDKVLFRTGERIRAVDDVSLALQPGEAHGIVGESGCGKSTLLEIVAGLERPDHGTVRYHGKPCSDFTKADWKAFRQDVQIVFQNPFESLDPKLTVRESLVEPLRVHGIDEVDRRIRQALDRVELGPADRYLEKLPDQLSGGEKQRVAIARALVLEPAVLLADEPVSMLDVSTQSGVLNTLSSLIDELNIALLYVSHDISTVVNVCDMVHVMYLGRIVETAPTDELVRFGSHPYTQALIDAVPVPDPHHDRERSDIDGSPKVVSGELEGCCFKERCPERHEACDREPTEEWAGRDHTVKCHLADDEARAVPAGTEHEAPAADDRGESL